MITIQHPGGRRQLTLQLDNLSPTDHRFIAAVVVLFTDPARAADLEALRRGERVLLHRPDGQCHCCPTITTN